MRPALTKLALLASLLPLSLSLAARAEERVPGLEHWSASIEIKGQELAIENSMATSAGEELSAEEAEALEPFLLDSQLPIVVFELEDDPAEARAPAKPQAAGRELASNTKTSARRKPAAVPHSTLIERLRARGAKIQIFKLARDRVATFSKNLADTAAFLGTFPTRIIREAATNPPSRGEVGWGIVQTAFLGVTQGISWFSSPGVPPMLAATITLSYIGLTASSTIYGVAFDRAFKSPQEFSKTGIRDADESVSDAEFMRRRRAFNYLYFGLMAFSGGNGDFAEGLHRLYEALPALMIDIESTVQIRKHFIQHFRTPVKNEKGELEIPAQARSLGTRFINLMYFCAFPLTLMGMSGYGPTLLKVGFYDLKLATVGTLGVYLALWSSIRFAPDKLKALLALPDKIGGISRRAIHKIRTNFFPTRTEACLGVFSLPPAN